jgi:hypothetical protein
MKAQLLILPPLFLLPLLLPSSSYVIPVHSPVMPRHLAYFDTHARIPPYDLPLLASCNRDGLGFLFSRVALSSRIASTFSPSHIIQTIITHSTQFAHHSMRKRWAAHYALVAALTLSSASRTIFWKRPRESVVCAPGKAYRV